MSFVEETFSEEPRQTSLLRGHIMHDVPSQNVRPTTENLDL